MRRIFVLCAFCAASLVASFQSARAYVGIQAGASPTPEGTIVVQWSTYEDTPGEFPQWTGYDVYRSSTDDCGTWVRINADPIPRPAGNGQDGITDTPPAAGKVYWYQVRPIDDARNEVFLSPCDCFGRNAWVAFPAGSVPIEQGTLRDVGWTLYVTPQCGCYGPAYLVFNGPVDPALQALAGTGAVVSFYGTMTCSGLEGCGLVFDRYVAGDCGITPVRASTWGRLKTLYR